MVVQSECINGFYYVMFHFQTYSSVNDIFESFLHQVVLEKFGHATPVDFRKVFIEYIKEYEDELEVRNQCIFV